jgi:hypothetical protein
VLFRLLALFGGSGESGTDHVHLCNTARCVAHWIAPSHVVARDWRTGCQSTGSEGIRFHSDDKVPREVLQWRG